MSRAPLSQSEKGLIAGLFAIPIVGSLHAFSTAVYYGVDPSSAQSNDCEFFLFIIGLYSFVAGFTFAIVTYLLHSHRPVIAWSAGAAVALSTIPGLLGWLTFRLLSG